MLGLTMPDNIDRLLEDEERAYEIGVKVARRLLAGRGQSHCENCEIPIPAARRQAVPSATRCRECQELYEAREQRNSGSTRVSSMTIAGDE